MKTIQPQNKGKNLVVQAMELNERFDKLQAENERLKEELRTEKIYSSQIEELEESLQNAKAENKELSESIKRLKNMAKAAALGREKYKQALQEIREELKEDTTCESRECGCDDYGECLNCLKETILTKIKEVIGAE